MSRIIVHDSVKYSSKQEQVPARGACSHDHIPILDTNICNVSNIYGMTVTILVVT